MKILLPLLISLILVGCAPSQVVRSKSYGAIVNTSASNLCGTRITKLGPDTFWGQPNVGSGCGLEYVLGDGNYYCSSQGREFLATKLSDNAIHFKCLPTSDPELHRPTYQKDPDVVVEVR